MEKDSKVHSAPNIPPMVARNKLRKLIHVPYHSGRPETARILPN